ncbi:G-protein-signaling modulator 3 [Rhinophrynus dorsalis]
MSVQGDSAESEETALVLKETAGPGDCEPTILELTLQRSPQSEQYESVFQDNADVSEDGAEDRVRVWRSAPPSPVSERRGISASLLSLHTEQFLDLLSTAQTRRLEEQRADLPPACPRPKRHMSHPPLRNFSLPADEKGLLIELQRRRGGSWRARSHKKKPPPLKLPAKEELYNTILGHQAQRMEDQRCSPPLPQGAADLFEILFRVQGNRLDEQRVELPSPLGGAC